ncbi:TPA: hypothetical protein F8R96_15860, partial [Legionella pneumophila]|nr:hypothetical protein [Legionella pneumophila]
MGMQSELVIGLVGGSGTNFNPIINYIYALLKDQFDEIHPIRLSRLIHEYFDVKDYQEDSFLKEIEYYQNQCDELAKKNSAIMGILAIDKISKSREKDKSNVYIINSLKRKNEFKVLNRVYGQNFILISIYESKKSRLNHLINEEQLRLPTVPHKEIEEKAECIIERDKHDAENNYGQSVRETYINASYFVSSDTYEEDIKRLFNILRGDPIDTPTQDEVAMAHAHIAALRSADLYRQVGAVITDNDGNIISTGCNEVPKCGGGYYWGHHHDQDDLRDYFVHDHGIPITQKIKEKIAKDLIDTLREQVKHIKKLDKALSSCEDKLIDTILNKGSI